MARSAEQIKKDVVDWLGWDDRVDASDVRVQVSDGSVTLTGCVPSFVAQRAAADDAFAVAGVERVDNQLAVRYPSTADKPSNAQLRSNARHALTWSPDLDAASIQVSAREGIATLAGTVDAYWKKLHAENLVRGLVGVVGVENKLAIAPKKRCTDKRIAQEIVAAIDRNPLIDAESINVTVEDGAVTLTGNATTWLGRKAAYEAALYTPGVTDINDQIAVPV